MLPNPPKISRFERLMLDSFAKTSPKFDTIKIDRNEIVYNCGDKNKNLYFINSGQIKILTLSPNGKECLLAIYSVGDIFGEQCLSEIEIRLDTAISMEKTEITAIPGNDFLDHLISNSLLELFIEYLAMRINEQQKTITDFSTIDSEHRLGKTLLQLAKKIGSKKPQKTTIQHKITQEELSEMVGTTRPRISQFMQNFRSRNLIEVSKDHFIVVKEKNLTNYLNKT